MPLRSTLFGMIAALLAGAVQPALGAANLPNQEVINAFTVWTATGSAQNPPVSE